MNKKLNIGLVGYGYIGKHHYKALRNLKKNFNIKIIFDNFFSEKDKKQLPKIIQLNNNFVKSQIPDNLDAIIICAPSHLHTKFIKIALSKVKTVITEKPIGLNFKSTRKIISQAINKKKKVIVVKQMRMSPVYTKLKKMLMSNILGRVHFISLNIFLNRSKKYFQDSDWKGKKKLDGGTLFNQISHFLDLFYWIFGDIKKVSGYKFIKNKFFNEDSGQISLFFKNNLFSSVNYSIKSHNKNYGTSLVILAENCSIEIVQNKMIFKSLSNKVKSYLKSYDKKEEKNISKKFHKGFEYFYKGIYDYLLNDKNDMNKLSVNRDALSSFRNLVKISSNIQTVKLSQKNF